MKDNKYIYRFLASVALCAYAYCGANMVSDLVKTVSDGEVSRPYIHLTNGDVIDPATAPITTKFEEDTAREFIMEAFADAEETPDLNQFLSRFTCSSCSKRCLLVAPSCFIGNGRQDIAIGLYQELYPDVELF